MSAPAVPQTRLVARVIDIARSLTPAGVLDALFTGAVSVTRASYATASLRNSLGRTLQERTVGSRLHAAPAPRPQTIPGVHRSADSHTLSLMLEHLGAPVIALFLERAVPFDDSDVNALSILAQFSSIALDNAGIVTESTVRVRWLTASQSITTSLLEGDDEEEGLQEVARQMRVISESEAAVIVLPSLEDMWISEFADGEGAEDLVGMVFPPGSPVRDVSREGSGRIDSDLGAREPESSHFRRFGPALIAPISVEEGSDGVIVLARPHGAPEFDLTDLAMAERVAKQAGLALTHMAEIHNEAQSAQMEDRAQISRDLHDLAIQQLFASGMQLAATREDLAQRDDVPRSAVEGLDAAISSINESVTQIRQIIYSLRDPGATTPLVTRLSHEYSTARTSLGFNPDTTLIFLGEEVAGDSDIATRIDDVVGSDLSDDIVAVLREGLSNVARHAEATAVQVTVAITDTETEITITDNGRGITEVGRRSGLSNLAARARRQRGSFSISPGPDGVGTSIRWTAGAA